MGGDRLEGASDGCDQGFMGSGLGTAEIPFDLAPHFFDGIEIRGIGRQKQDLSPGLGDQGQCLIVFVRGQVIHHHQISRPEGRTQHFPNIGLEHFRVSRPVDGQTGRGPVHPNGTDHGGGLPMAVRGVGVDPLAPRGAAAQTGQIGLGRRFVQKD